MILSVLSAHTLPNPWPSWAIFQVLSVFGRPLRVQNRTITTLQTRQRRYLRNFANVDKLHNSSVNLLATKRVSLPSEFSVWGWSIALRGVVRMRSNRGTFASQTYRCFCFSPNLSGYCFRPQPLVTFVIESMIESTELSMSTTGAFFSQILSFHCTTRAHPMPWCSASPSLRCNNNPMVPPPQGGA